MADFLTIRQNAWPGFFAPGDVFPSGVGVADAVPSGMWLAVLASSDAIAPAASPLTVADDGGSQGVEVPVGQVALIAALGTASADSAPNETNVTRVEEPADGLHSADGSERAAEPGLAFYKAPLAGLEPEVASGGEAQVNVPVFGSGYLDTAIGMLPEPGSGSLSMESAGQATPGSLSMESAGQATPGSLSMESAGQATSVEYQTTPIEYQTPSGPNRATEQAFVDLQFGLFIHYGINTYTFRDGHGNGGRQAPIYTNPYGEPGQNPAPASGNDRFQNKDRQVPKAKNRVYPSELFDPPYKTQDEFKRYVVDSWMREAKAAGMKYINYTTKHHFGWSGWPSEHTLYDTETSSAPNIDTVQAVIDSAKDFDMKVVLYYSTLDRVHHWTPKRSNCLTGTSVDCGDANDNNAYYAFVKNQMDELLAYDPSGDTIIGLWFDYADGRWGGAGGGQRQRDLRDYVWGINPNIIQMNNRFSNLATVNYENPGAENDRAATLRRDFREPGELEINIYGWIEPHTRPDLWPRSRAVNGANFDSPHWPLDRTFSWFRWFDDDSVRQRLWWYHGKDLRPIEQEVTLKNDLNLVYCLNVPPGPSGVMGENALELLVKAGKALNGGGRVDDFDLGWRHEGSWNHFINRSDDWSNPTPSRSQKSWLKTLHYASASNAYAEYKFFGRSVKLYVRAAGDAGDMDIYIDGAFQSNFNSRTSLGSSASAESVLAYSTSSLSYGEHTIRVAVGSVQSGRVYIDFLEVAPRIERVEVMPKLKVAPLYTTGVTGEQYGTRFVKLINEPEPHQIYTTGDTLEIGVTFSGFVKVTGTPQIEIDVGGEARVARYASGSGTRVLRFHYTVEADDVDTDGISIGANKITLNGGVIEVDDDGSADTTDADLNHEATAGDSFYKVIPLPTVNTVTVGNDLLVGQAGDSEYLLGMKTGFDEVYEGYASDMSTVRAQGDGGDVLRLDADIGTGDVRLLRDQSSVWVQVLGADDGSGDRPVVSSVKLVDYYENEQSKVERIVFADGTEWGRAELHRIAIRGGVGADILYGHGGMNDIFASSAGGNDVLLGLGGDDEYRLGMETGFDEIYEGYSRVETGRFGRGRGVYVSSDHLRGSGDSGDVIRLDAGIGAGDVSLVRDGDSVVVQVLGVAANDGKRPVVASLKVFGYYANDASKVESLVFGDGSVWSGDLLVGSSSSDVLSGSSADEVYYGGGGVDTYMFGRDFGSDVVAGDAGSGKAVFSAYKSGQLSFGKDGEDLLVSVSGAKSHQVRFDGWLAGGGSRTIETSNGNSLEVAKIIQAMSAVQAVGTDKPQTIAIEEESWTPIATF